MQLTFALPIALLFALAAAAPLGSPSVTGAAMVKREPNPPGQDDHHGDHSNDWKNASNNWGKGWGGDNKGGNNNNNNNNGQTKGPGYPANGGDANNTDENGNCVPGLGGVATDGNQFWIDNCEG